MVMRTYTHTYMHARTHAHTNACRYCLYPQELVLRLDLPGPVRRIRKLQLLSHQYMIGTIFT